MFCHRSATNCFHAANNPARQHLGRAAQAFLGALQRPPRRGRHTGSRTADPWTYQTPAARLHVSVLYTHVASFLVDVGHTTWVGCGDELSRWPIELAAARRAQAGELELIVAAVTSPAMGHWSRCPSDRRSTPRTTPPPGRNLFLLP